MLGAMKQMQFDSGTLTSNYWGGQVNSTVNSSAYTLADDNYIYMFGVYTSGARSAYVIKFNNLGVVQWSINTTSALTPSHMTQDSNYLYLVGYDLRNSGVTQYDCGRVLQLNKSDGSIVSDYQQNLTAQSTSNIFNHISISANGNWIISQTQSSTGSGYEGIVSLNPGLLKYIT
jgi:hypothetical protein